MAFPVSPSNGQRAIVNGITYTFNSGTNSWTRVTNAGSVTNPALYTGSVTATTATTLIDTLPVSGNTYLRWTITSIDNLNTNFAGTLYDAINDGTNVYSAQTGTIQSNPLYQVATFTSNISDGNVNLWANGDSNNVTVSFKREVLGSSTTTGYMNAGSQGPQGQTGGVGAITNTTGVIHTTNTTAATSTSTGALQVAGGAGIAGNVYVGGAINVAGPISAQTVTATSGIDMNYNTISSSINIPAGANAQSIGPISQNPDVVVTLPPGSRWMIV